MVEATFFANFLGVKLKIGIPFWVAGSCPSWSENYFGGRVARDYQLPPIIKLISGMRIFSGCCCGPSLEIVGAPPSSCYQSTGSTQIRGVGVPGQAFNAFDGNVIQNMFWQLLSHYFVHFAITDLEAQMLFVTQHICQWISPTKYEMWNVGHKIMHWNYSWSWLGCSVKFERERSDMTGPFIMTPEMYCTWATARNINNQLWPECIKSSESIQQC